MVDPKIDIVQTGTGWQFSYEVDGKTYTGPSYRTPEAARDAGLMHSRTTQSGARRGAR